MQEEILKRIESVLVGTFGVPASKIRTDALLIDDLDLDSIDLFDLVGVFEKEHGVQLDVSDFRGVMTVEDLVVRVSTLISAASLEKGGAVSIETQNNTSFANKSLQGKKYDQGTKTDVVDADEG